MGYPLALQAPAPQALSPQPLPRSRIPRSRIPCSRFALVRKLRRKMAPRTLTPGPAAACLAATFSAAASPQPQSFSFARFPRQLSRSNFPCILFHRTCLPRPYSPHLPAPPHLPRTRFFRQVQSWLSKGAALKRHGGCGPKTGRRLRPRNGTAAAEEEVGGGRNGRRKK